jgi:hypothetical protein
VIGEVEMDRYQNVGQWFACDGWVLVNEGDSFYLLQRETWDRSLFEGVDAR